jgi:carboxylate-amine ligase
MEHVTLGVEEEYLLLDPGSGVPSPQVASVQAAAEGVPFLDRSEVGNELLQAQIEVATPVCSRLSEVAAHLTRLRSTVASAAARVGCRLNATGAAPFAAGSSVPVSPKQRYRDMHAEARLLVDEQLICGMHVHVGVPSRGIGAAALGRIRPWLPVLVALAANSPFWEGGDTGFASWRMIISGRWPVAGPPPFTEDAEAYEREVARVLGTGVIRDTGQIYWHARLSERYPTLEVRVPDVQLDVDSAVTLAGLARGLVVTALREAGYGVAPVVPPDTVLRAAEWHAARYGVTGDLVHPVHGTPAAAGEVVAELLDHLAPALRECGDLDYVATGVKNLQQQGGGASLQREAVARGGPPALLDATAAARP